MLQIRKSDARGKADHGWLTTRFTFSFAEYFDPHHVQFRGLRVLNEDRIAGGRGFPMHPHRDMEIISVVLEGALEHRDNLGNGAIMRPGDIQRMSAGTGIVHSEFNPSDDETHMFQIWLLPERPGLKPGYADKTFDTGEWHNRLGLVVSPEGRNGSLDIQTDASLYVSQLDAGKRVTHTYAPDRHGWLQLSHGAVAVNGESLTAGDGVAISEETDVTIEASEDARFLLFDLA